MWVVCVNFTVGVKCYVCGLYQFHSVGKVLCVVCVNFSVMKCYVSGLYQFHGESEVLCVWSVSISQWG